MPLFLDMQTLFVGQNTIYVPCIDLDERVDNDNIYLLIKDTVLFTEYYVIALVLRFTMYNGFRFEITDDPLLNDPDNGIVYLPIGMVRPELKLYDYPSAPIPNNAIPFYIDTSEIIWQP